MGCKFTEGLERLEMAAPHERATRRPMRGDAAAHRLRAMAADPQRCAQMRRAAAAAEPWRDLSGVSDVELLRRAQEDLRCGRTQLQPPSMNDPWVRYLTRPQIEMPEEPESDLEDLSEHHFVEFLVLDGNGDPYPGLDYVLQGPDGDKEDGQLGDSGNVRKDDVFTPDYALTICDVASVEWKQEQAAPDEEVTLTAVVAGYEDGTDVEVRLFRQYRETDDDVVESLTATVEDGSATATWTYVHDPDGPLGDLDGVVPIVAEVRVGSDGPWAKTTMPLSLQLPTLDAARWSVESVAPGEEVEIQVRTLGIADGTTMTIEVFAQWRTGEQECIESLSGLEVTGGEVKAPFTLEPEDDEEAGPAEAECFFIATLDDDDEKVATSESLWVTAHVS